MIRSDSESDIDQFVTVESYSTFPSVPPTFICELTDIGFAFSFCANQQTFALENNVESSEHVHFRNVNSQHWLSAKK